MAQCFSFAKEENMVQRCGCSNTKDEIKGISIHQIPFYGDTRSEAVKRRGKWISFVNGNRKHWTPTEQVFSRFARCIPHQKISFAR